jgi:tetratricopeptide (TPR) repeat protein
MASRWLAAFMAALAAASASAQRPPASSPPDPLSILERYARGDGAAAVAILEDVPDDRLDDLGKSVQRVARDWVNVSNSAEARKRRLAAATLMLDLAHAGLAEEWKALRPLVEWGCGLVRQNPAGELEHEWHRAAVALAGGASDYNFLKRPLVSSGDTGVVDHLRHAQAQFPDDPRWRLAGAVALAVPGMGEGIRDGSGPRRMTADSIEFPQQTLQRRREESKPAIKALTELLETPAVAAEAHLFLGHRAFVLREIADAIRHYGEAHQKSSDPYVRYLADFLAGRLFDAGAKPLDAQLHYRRALQTLPNTQSATLALAVLRQIGGAPDEAYALVDSAFAAEPRPPDPWRLFYRGDYRMWPAVMQRLRAGLR